MSNSNVEQADNASSISVKRSQVPPAPKMVVAKDFARVYETPAEGTYQRIMSAFGGFFGCLGTIPCSCCTNPYKNVDAGEVGLVTRFGALARTVEPGSTYVNTWVEKISKVSIRAQTIQIPSQDCLTKDNVGVEISSVLYFSIVDPQLATFGIEDVNASLVNRTQTTLRDVIGARILQDVIEKREEIAAAISENISHVAEAWGVHVESILIKDIHLPPGVSASLSRAAEATRIGESKIISAKAEVESAKLMRKAADILASDAAMQMRYLDAMQSMAKSSNSKVIFMPSSTAAGANMIEASPSNGAHFGSTKEDLDRAVKTIALDESLKN
ncbi:hypothetical protein DASC09_043820 [Saccharomycopsis crataegensis]|uniref:Band 7 domain-containing protein n=1 Tax=Saccharomycopsis crataegensis TaxID=43959 RepID=A0AAV5QRH2_9ASCO|nr:hypothetical protein DASC09_043820 [Saccharomycopsis crataegensis]